MTPLLSITYFLLILSFFIAHRTFRDYQKRGGLPYPPGPRPLPVIGNLLDIPRESSWLAYTQLAKKYGMSSTFSESSLRLYARLCRRHHVFPRSRTSHRHFGLCQDRKRS